MTLNPIREWGVMTEWHPASTPPPTSDDDWGCWHQSDPVLVFDGTKMFCAIYQTDPDNDFEPSWRTTCSEGWDVTKRVTHWQPLPEPPKT